MKLLTKEIMNKMPLPEEVITDKDTPIIVKFFGGCSYTLYVIAAYAWVEGVDGNVRLSEINGRKITDINFYGYVTGLQTDEWGYTTLNQLKAIKFPPFGLPIERDRNCSKRTVKELQ